MHESERNYNLVKILCLSDDQGNTLMSFVVVDDVYVSKISHATLISLGLPCPPHLHDGEGKLWRAEQSCIEGRIAGQQGGGPLGEGAGTATLHGPCVFLY